MLGLTGSHRSGKSTLAKAVAKEMNVNFMEHNAAGNILKGMNLSLNENWTLHDRFEFQVKLLDAFEEALKGQKESFISDRTPIDIAAYMYCEVQKAGDAMGSLDGDIEDLLKRAYEITNRFYGCVVHVPVALPYIAVEGKPLPLISYQKQHGFISTGMMMTQELKIPVYFMAEEVLSMRKRIDYIFQSYRDALLNEHSSMVQ